MVKLALGLALLLPLLVIAGTGCSDEATPTATATPEATATSSPSPTATIAPGPTPAPTATATPGPTPGATGPVALPLDVTAPENESVVSTETVLLTGRTRAGAVVTVLVDDRIEVADVASDGSFSVAVTLLEGPNYIEVITSDLTGNDASTAIVVIYVP